MTDAVKCGLCTFDSVDFFFVVDHALIFFVGIVHYTLYVLLD